MVNDRAIHTGDETLTGFTPNALYQLQLVSKIALHVSAFAAFTLIGTIYILTDTGEITHYLSSIQSISSMKNLLPKAILISGLIVVVFVGLMTWLISIYSSAKISGPLYRFSKNIELTIEHNSAPHIKIRTHDKLHAEADLLETAIFHLNQHYQALNHVAEEIQELLKEDSINRSKLAAKIHELKITERRIQLHGH